MASGAEHCYRIRTTCRSKRDRVADSVMSAMPVCSVTCECPSDHTDVCVHFTSGLNPFHLCPIVSRAGSTATPRAASRSREDRPCLRRNPAVCPCQSQCSDQQLALCHLLPCHRPPCQSQFSDQQLSSLQQLSSSWQWPASGRARAGRRAWINQSSTVRCAVCSVWCVRCGVPPAWLPVWPVGCLRFRQGHWSHTLASSGGYPLSRLEDPG
jgi:hypothetical protein